jgi:hypothetical protein
MRYLPIKLPKTRTFLANEEGEEEEEEEFEEIPEEEYDRARVGLYLPKNQNQSKSILTRVLDRFVDTVPKRESGLSVLEEFLKEQEEFKRELANNPEKLREIIFGTKDFMKKKEIIEDEEFDKEYTFNRTSEMREKRRKEVFKDMELPVILACGKSIPNVLQKEVERYKRDLKKDEEGLNEEDDDDEYKVSRRQMLFTSRSEREGLYALAPEALEKLDCVENLLKRQTVPPPRNNREFECFSANAAIHEKEKRAYLELPIMLSPTKTKRTFLERVWPITIEERSAIKMTPSEVSEDSKFAILDKETARGPLFKPQKIEDIDAYVEKRKITVKTSTLPSFMLPVEENFPIRYGTTTTVVQAAAGATTTALPGFQSPPRRVEQREQQQQQQKEQDIPNSPRFLATNFPSSADMIQDSVDFYKACVGAGEYPPKTTTVDNEWIANNAQQKNTPPGSASKQHHQTKLNFTSPRRTVQKDNGEQPELEFVGFRLPEHPHGTAVREIEREYNTIREFELPNQFNDICPTFEAVADYDLYAPRIEMAEERLRREGNTDLAGTLLRMKDLLSVGYSLESYGVTVAHLQLRYANNQSHTTTSNNNNSVFSKARSKAQSALEAAVESVHRGDSLDNPKLLGLQPLIGKCKSSSGGTKMLIVVPESKPISSITKYIHSIGGKANCLPSKKFLEDGQSEQEEQLFVEEVRKIVSKNNLDALIVLEQHFARGSFPVADFQIVVFYAPSRRAPPMVENAIATKRFRGVEEKGILKVFTNDVLPTARTQIGQKAIDDELMMPHHFLKNDVKDEKNISCFENDDDILGFDDIVPISKTPERREIDGVIQTRLVVLEANPRTSYMSILTNRIELQVSKSSNNKQTRVIRRRLFDRIPDSSNKEAYKRIVSIISMNFGVKAICLFRMSNTPEMQRGDLREVLCLAQRTVKALSQSFYQVHFIFEIDPKCLRTYEMHNFRSHLQHLSVKDEIYIEVTFSSESDIVENISNAITFEEDENEINDDNDGPFPHLADTDFALIPSDSANVWEIALNDLFPYVNAITLLVLIEHGLGVEKVIKDRSFPSREDYETCEAICGCPMKAFKTRDTCDDDDEKDAEDALDDANEILYENTKKYDNNNIRTPQYANKSPSWQNVVEARKDREAEMMHEHAESMKFMQSLDPNSPGKQENVAMIRQWKASQSPMHSPMHSKSQNLHSSFQQQQQQKMIPNTRPNLGIGSFMATPSPIQKANDEDDYYFDSRAAPSNNTSLETKHQQGRDAVERMMSKQKRGLGAEKQQQPQRLIASPQRQRQPQAIAPPTSDFFRFNEHFRPEAFLKDGFNSGKTTAPSASRKKETFTTKKETTTTMNNNNNNNDNRPNFKTTRAQNEFSVFNEDDDEFPISPNITTYRGRRD